MFKALKVAVVSIKWLIQLEDIIKQWVKSTIDTIIIISTESEPTQDLKNLLSRALGARTVVQLARNRKQITFAVLFLSAFAFLILYFYLAVLFSFAYYGVARIQSVAYTWSDALVTSLFIPFAYGDLPRNPWLKLLGGFQATLAVLLSFGAVFGFFQKKLNSLYQVAEAVNLQFEKEEIKTKLDDLNKRWKIINVPSR